MTPGKVVLSLRGHMCLFRVFLNSDGIYYDPKLEIKDKKQKHIIKYCAFCLFPFSSRTKKVSVYVVCRFIEKFTHSTKTKQKRQMARVSKVPPLFTIKTVRRRLFANVRLFV